ncbi:MAG: hypothetical protein JNN07_23130 [Verrucomicrobiales bacterium]|nr:hypothetical protein [Verrucomicrobiales bacterium]
MNNIEIIICLVLLFMAVPDACKKLGRPALALVHASVHDGKRLEEYVAPISHRFLIPVFFVALGLEINWRLFLDEPVLLAVATAFVLLAAREVLHRRWLKTDGDGRAFLLLCPNLTIVALAAKAMLDHGTDARLTAWLVITGLFMTISAILVLPMGTEARTASDDPHQEGPVINSVASGAASTASVRELKGNG